MTFVEQIIIKESKFPGKIIPIGCVKTIKIKLRIFSMNSPFYNESFKNSLLNSLEYLANSILSLSYSGSNNDANRYFCYTKKNNQSINFKLISIYLKSPYFTKDFSLFITKAYS